MAISLNVTSAAVTSAITIYLAVFALGQLLLGPLSDRYGRHWPVFFWQMMNAAVGVWLAATVSHQAMFALGVVLTIFSLAALGLYALKPSVD
jgi:MFS family permease